MPKETVPKEIIEILGSIDLTHPYRMAHFHRLYNVVSESLSGQVLKLIRNCHQGETNACFLLDSPYSDQAYQAG